MKQIIFYLARFLVLYLVHPELWYFQSLSIFSTDLNVGLPKQTGISTLFFHIPLYLNNSPRIVFLSKLLKDETSNIPSKREVMITLGII